MNDIDRAAAANVEPYIGMPIYLDDCDDIMDGISGDIDVNNPENTTPGGTRPGNTMPGGSTPGSDSIAECVNNLPLAMAYVPMQRWEETYEPGEALMNGTVFPSLNLPFLGGAKR